jgi:hypothetical protein
MKKHRRQNMTKKMTLLAGMTATALVATPAHADVAGDSLINKLEQKGILTTDEAKELRAENQQDFNGSFTNSFDKAFSGKTGMPDWVTGYKLSGDFRGRFDQISADNNAMIDRARLRYRLRVGLTVNMLDNLEAGFRLGTGDYPGSNGGNPLSNNSTMQDNFSKKSVYIDTAYGKWKMLNSGDWLLAATIGKMDNPFNFTPMVFDPDLTPEGAALQGGYTINDKNNIAFAGAAFVLDEEGKFGAAPGSASASTTHDPFMYGGQVMWNAKWTPKWSSSLGVGAFAIGSPQQLTTANVAENNQGNTRYAYTPSGLNAVSVVGLKYNYNPIIADASVTYTLDSFPLYQGKFPVKFAGEFMNNPGAPKNNNAFWIGATFGKSGKKHTWDLSYRYEHLEADAWYDQMVDDDNGAFYATGLYANNTASAGWYGGTNIKGHLIKFNYSITDSFIFSTTCYVNSLINQPAQSTIPVNLNSDSIHVMADLMWKF